MPDSLIRKLIGRCDALFILHRDPDHADRTVTAIAAAGRRAYPAETAFHDRAREGITACAALSFISEETPEGAPGEMEVARLPLDSFQTL